MTEGGLPPIKSHVTSHAHNHYRFTHKTIFSPGNTQLNFLVWRKLHARSNHRFRDKDVVNYDGWILQKLFLQNWNWRKVPLLSILGAICLPTSGTLHVFLPGSMDTSKGDHGLFGSMHAPCAPHSKYHPPITRHTFPFQHFHLFQVKKFNWIFSWI